MKSVLSREVFRLGKDASVYGLSSAISRGVAIFMAPILTRIFAPEDYGVIALIQLAVSFFVIIAGMNIGSGIYYYFYKYESAEERRTVLTTGLVVITLFSMTTAGMLYLYAEKVVLLLQIRTEGPIEGHDLVGYLRIASIGMFFSLMGSAFTSILRLERKPVRYMQVELSSVAVNLVSVLVLVVALRAGIEGVFWSGVLSAASGFLLACAFVIRRFGRRLSLAMLGLILAYALPQMPGLLVNWSQVQLGRIFLNYHFSAADLGLYSIAFVLASVLTLVTTAFRMAYDPYAFSIMKNEDASDKYAKIYLLFSVVTCGLVGILGAFAKPILMVLTPPVYHSAYELVVFFLVAVLYSGKSNILGVGIWITGRTVYTTHAQVLSFAVLFIANLVLVPALGTTGAALAYLIGTAAQSLAVYYFAQKLWPVPYAYLRMNWLAFAILLIVLLHGSMIAESSLLLSLFAAVVTSAVVVLVCWQFGLSHSARKQAVALFRDFQANGLKM